jgi:hypothetical protein
MIAHEYGLLDHAGAVVRAFGGDGQRLGQFDGARAATACSVPRLGGLGGGSNKRDQLVAVSEAGSCRVQIFRASDGAPVRELDNLNNPGQVDFGGSDYLDDPSLLCADRDNHRIQVWRGTGDQFVASYGTEGEVGGSSGTGGGKKDTQVKGRAKMGADYNGALACELSELKLSHPGGACWCESDEGANAMVVADSGNHRLQLLDLDRGTVRVLAGRDKVTAPSMVCYHNGWRWCSGAQATPPLPPSAWPVPPWYLAAGTAAAGAAAAGTASSAGSASRGGAEDEDDAAAEAAALEVWAAHQEERAAAEAEFEEQQRLSGGRCVDAAAQGVFVKQPPPQPPQIPSLPPLSFFFACCMRAGWRRSVLTPLSTC